MLFPDPACSKFGTKIHSGKSDLFYTKNVTETDAEKLGDFPVKEAQIKRREIWMQLDKSGSDGRDAGKTERSKLKFGTWCIKFQTSKETL